MQRMINFNANTPFLGFSGICLFRPPHQGHTSAGRTSGGVKLREADLTDADYL